MPKKTAFLLKREGSLDEAMQKYAAEFRKALGVRNSYIAAVCFEQMFDILLLKYSKEYVRFPSPNKLLEDIDGQLHSYLAPLAPGSLKEEEFQELMDQCERKLFPRGRAKGVFSVQAKELLEKKQARKG